MSSDPAIRRPENPFSVRVKDVEKAFGIKAQTIYDWITNGRLARGTHYLKVGGRVLIVYDAFVQFLREEDSALWR